MELLVDPGETEVPRLAGIEQAGECSVISVVGSGVEQEPQILQRILELLGAARPPVPVDELRLEEACITLRLGLADASEAMHLLHQELMGNPVVSPGGA